MKGEGEAGSRWVGARWQIVVISSVVQMGVVWGGQVNADG